MTDCITKYELCNFLAKIQQIYDKFLKSEISSDEAKAAINLLIEEYKNKEYRGGNYSSRIICLLPSCDSPIITLQLLYKPCGGKCDDDENLFLVSITLVPHPNNKESLVLSPSSKNQCCDGGISGGCDIGNSICVFKSKKCEEKYPDTVIICGGKIEKKDKKSLDFLKFLCKKFKRDFAIRRDKKCRRWLICDEWDNDLWGDEKFIHHKFEDKCFIDYDKLKCYIERHSCFKFNNCDLADIVSTTCCYEIWISCVNNILMVHYAAKKYLSLPRYFREIVEYTDFICIPNSPSLPPSCRPILLDVDEVCNGPYGIVEKLYCCCKMKYYGKCCVKFYCCCDEHKKEHYGKCSSYKKNICDCKKSDNNCCDKKSDNNCCDKKSDNNCCDKESDNNCSDKESDSSCSDKESDSSCSDKESSSCSDKESSSCSDKESSSCSDKDSNKENCCHEYKNNCCDRSWEDQHDDVNSYGCYYSENNKSDTEYYCPYKQDKCCYKNDYHSDDKCEDECCYEQYHYPKNGDYGYDDVSFNDRQENDEDYDGYRKRYYSINGGEGEYSDSQSDKGIYW